MLLNVSKSNDVFGKSVAEFMVPDLVILPSGVSEDELMKTLTEGKVAIIYAKDIFIGFITKVDLINHYRTKINQD